MLKGLTVLVVLVGALAVTAMTAGGSGFAIGAIKIAHPIAVLSRAFVAAVIMYGMLGPRSESLPSPGVFLMLYWLFMILWFIKLLHHYRHIGTDAPFREQFVEMPFHYAVGIWASMVLFGVVVGLVRFGRRPALT